MNALLLSSSGMVAACIDGEQVPELQRSFLDLWSAHAQRLGYDPTRFIFTDADGRMWRIEAREGGFSRTLIE